MECYNWNKYSLPGASWNQKERHRTIFKTITMFENKYMLVDHCVFTTYLQKLLQSGRWQYTNIFYEDRRVIIIIITMRF